MLHRKELLKKGCIVARTCTSTLDSTRLKKNMNFSRLLRVLLGQELDMFRTESLSTLW